MKKVKTKQELVFSLLNEFKLDQPAIDATMSKVDFKILAKAVNSTRTEKPFDRFYLKAKIKWYLSAAKNGPIRAPLIDVPMDINKYRELKKRLDQRVKHIIN